MSLRTLRRHREQIQPFEFQMCQVRQAKNASEYYRYIKLCINSIYLLYHARAAQIQTVVILDRKLN